MHIVAASVDRRPVEGQQDKREQQAQHAARVRKCGVPATARLINATSMTFQITQVTRSVPQITREKASKAR
ncbi:ORFL277W [Human betaherpesvirus 5]|nr:ORFL277W [Human betaherpesvirus 5]